MTTATMHHNVRRWRRGNNQELRTTKAHLTHLIYSMEHDQSLDAETSKIASLKQMLASIERQLQSINRYSPL